MILLDTHVVIWLINAPERISRAAAQAIAEAGADGTLPAISIVSLYEIAYAQRRGRVQIHIADAELVKRIREWFDLRPITDTIMLEAARLPEPFHGDPLDRLIAATAIVEDRVLLTSDRAIRAAGRCKTVW